MFDWFLLKFIYFIYFYFVYWFCTFFGNLPIPFWIPCPGIFDKMPIPFWIPCPGIFDKMPIPFWIPCPGVLAYSFLDSLPRRFSVTCLFLSGFRVQARAQAGPGPEPGPGPGPGPGPSVWSVFFPQKTRPGKNDKSYIRKFVSLSVFDPAGGVYLHWRSVHIKVSPRTHAHL